MATTPDVPARITSDNASAERRITLAWTVAHFKARLEPITGIPASCQRLTLTVPPHPPQRIEAANEDATPLARWPFQADAEIHVGRPFRHMRPSRFVRACHCLLLGGGPRVRFGLFTRCRSR